MEFNIEKARDNMIKQQLRTWDVLDETVLEVFATVPRERFVPERYKNLAFADLEIPLGHHQVMMPPKIEGRMVQALSIKSTDNVLEIGTGSGFVTACLAHLGDQVESVDIYEDFSTRAKQNLADNDITNVTLKTGDAAKGWDTGMRYDVIAVTGSLPEYDAWFESNLTIGGRLFVIVGVPPVMEAMLVSRASETEFVRNGLFETAIPPLVNAIRRPQFTL